MNPLLFGRLIAGIFVLTSKADGPPPAALEAVVAPMERSWYIEVIPMPAGIDFKIDVFHSDPNVRCEIVVLGSHGLFRAPRRTGSTPESGELRRVLTERRRVTR